MKQKITKKMNEIVITDKHNAGKFVRQVIENNFEKFKSLRNKSRTG